VRAILLSLLILFAAPLRAETLADWAVAVVAGDWQAHSGNPTAAFENARRDIVWSLEKAGVTPDNLIQFSPTARLRGDAGVLLADRPTIERNWYALTRRATGGCLFYLTSHGNQGGVVLSGAMLTPAELDMMLDLSCGERPTVVVISACFSGVFVPVLAGPNRFVMTAARRDRSSFGCSEDATYPYFDDCVIRSLPTARDFPALGAAARTCVAARERQERLAPPSEPQMSVGADIAPLLARLPLGNPRR
jgi:hypothetical protein